MLMPCIKDKCLKYPVCKTKRQIRCAILHKYYMHMVGQTSLTGTEAWDYIREGLPNAGSISDNEEGN